MGQGMGRGQVHRPTHSESPLEVKRGDGSDVSKRHKN